jgi:RNA polymerase sigma-70 factor (ECF subfamily)
VPVPTRFEFDSDYVERLAAGDAEIERHFTRYFSDLLTLKLRSRLGSRTLVEDATQEVFVRVLTTLREKGGLASAGSLGAFVNGVCNNVLFETYRAESRRRQHVPDDDVERVEPGPSAEADLATADDQVRVRQALCALPEKDQRLLRALFFDDRDKDEICRTLGVDRGHLRVLLHRAKARFRDALGTRPAASVTPRSPRTL